MSDGITIKQQIAPGETKKQCDKREQHSS
jgi:hypothetical protein